MATNLSLKWSDHETEAFQTVNFAHYAHYALGGRLLNKALRLFLNLQKRTRMAQMMMFGRLALASFDQSIDSRHQILNQTSCSMTHACTHLTMTTILYP